jgi:hypothetical protein
VNEGSVLIIRRIPLNPSNAQKVVKIEKKEGRIS